MRLYDDTIAAIATPPGEGGIAIVRVSGAATRDVATRLLRNRRGTALDLRPGAVSLGQVVDPVSGGPVDEALVLWMPGPGSYTREDVLEIQCHGGQAAARGVLDAVLAAGPRLADPGEFTLRAYLRGRIDLIQAEAVLDVIQARTSEALRIHEQLLEGQLSNQARHWQDRLRDALVPLEAHLDFPEEEDLGALAPEEVLAHLADVSAGMESKLASFEWGRTNRDGFTVALVGSPNTGKSSLFNRLVGEDRVIVSPSPGTTRDTIEGWSNAQGVPVRLVDTAGLRRASEAVEEEGVRRAEQAAARADLILFVCDGGRPLHAEEHAKAEELAQRGRALPLVNKRDLGVVPATALTAVFAREPIEVSALTGVGLHQLQEAIRAACWQGQGRGAETPLTRRRHRDAVAQALACVRRSRDILESAGFPELAASELHAARRALAELLGAGAPEEVLEAIFQEFCIGK